MDKIYKKQKWLNGNKSSSTGSVVAYSGPASWGKSDDEREIETFFEVADCTYKARLHKCRYDKMEDFIDKIETLGRMAFDFADYLKQNAI